MKKYNNKRAAKLLFNELHNRAVLTTIRDDFVGTPTDYTDAENWLYVDCDNNHEVDLIYFYPTVSTASTELGFSEIDQSMKDGAYLALAKQAAVLSDMTNIYAPYYRQMTLDVLADAENSKVALDKTRNSVVRTDVFAALDVYFSCFNQGRPFILAGHSQGSLVIELVLSDYMKEHPDLLNRMVAAYVIGYCVTKDYLESNPHLKFAQGEKDTGVIISWNTEGPNPQMESKLISKGSISINPINWTLDETPASMADNIGSLIVDPVTNQFSIVKGRGDATVDTKRGSVVCTTLNQYLPAGIFGDKSLHTEDWSLYNQNIMQNVFDRITAYLGYKPLSGTALDYSNEENWLRFEDEPSKKADLFFIYPTITMSNGGKITSVLDDEHMATAELCFQSTASGMSSFTNVFAPFYRQVTLDGACTAISSESYCDLVRRHKGITDIFAALDYYFENCNNGRPFLFASHSQGSATVRIILEEYMKKHPDYLERMIAAYALGYNFSDEYYLNNPHLKSAEGELDTGVIISWNTEGPCATEYSVVVGEHGRSINPINWKTDDTPASAEENKGSLVLDPVTNTSNIVAGYADACLDLNRGSLVTTASEDYITTIDIFGDKSLHGQDWGFYLVNTLENASKRVDEYLQNHPNC